MTEGRALTRLVILDGQVWEAGSVPPPEVAERIRNPQAWQTLEDLVEQIQPENQPPWHRVEQPVAEPLPAVDGLRNLEPQNPGNASGRVAEAQPGVISGRPDPQPDTEPDPGPAVQADQTAAAVQEPPRSGRGSSEAAWRAYADQLGVDVSDLDERGDIIARLKADGHIQ